MLKVLTVPVLQVLTVPVLQVLTVPVLKVLIVPVLKGTGRVHTTSTGSTDSNNSMSAS